MVTHPATDLVRPGITWSLMVKPLQKFHMNMFQNPMRSHVNTCDYMCDHMWLHVITCDFGTCSCEIFVREGNALTAYATRTPIKKKKLQRHEDKHNNVMITSFAFVLFRSVNPVQANAGRPWKSRSILQRIAGKIASGICQSYSSKREKPHTPREVLAQNICPRNSNKAMTSHFICARANYHPPLGVCW